MGHEHGHAHGGAGGPGDRRRLALALGITAAMVLVEFGGALLSGSLALLADAGHLAGDGIGLVVAIVAASIAGRPATDRHTFGFRRFEVLGALSNGVLLLVVAGGVAVEGVRRLVESASGAAPTVAPVPMLLVACLGLLANLVALAVLRGGDRASLNLRGAVLEVAGDALGSVLAIAAAITVLLTGFSAADAVASLVVAALIVPRALALLVDVTRVLTESAPRGTDVELIREHLLGTAGVVDVHDVHVWAITSGAPVFTAHVEVEPGVFERGESGALLDRLGGCLAGHFDVEHSTFQLEPAGRAAGEQHRHR